MDLFSPDYNIVKAAIENGVSIDTYDMNGYTALHQAAKKGYIKIARLLIKNGADVNKKCRTYQDIPLSYAASYSKINIVKLLVENGSNMDIRYVGYSQELRRYLIRNGMPAIRREILRYGTYKQNLKLGNISLEEAAYSFEATKVYKGDINLRLKNGSTVLHEAVWDDNIEWVEYLLKRGADQFIKDRNGRVALNAGLQLKRRIFYLLRDSINVPNDDNDITLRDHFDTKLQAYLVSLGADYTILKKVDFTIERHYNYFVKTKNLLVK